jgi:hypothetical protein
LLDHEDVIETINWYDGRPKSMFLSLWTGNKSAIEYAFPQDLVDEEMAIESSFRDYLQS